MLKWITLASFSFCLTVHARAPGSFTGVRTELEKVSQKDLINTLNNFIKPSLPSRMVGQPGHESAQKFIEFTINIIKILFNNVKFNQQNEQNIMCASQFQSRRHVRKENS
jgi:hypothetical protein